MKRRKDISEARRREVYDFYGGRESVLSGTIRGTLHHIDGDPSNDSFENLVPLQHEVHSGIPPPASPRGEGILTSADGKMDPQALREKGRDRYREGKTAHAFGCARLAHGVRRYYRWRRPDDELCSLRDALYYLRRCFVLNPIQSLRLLKYILEDELLRTLKAKPVINATTTVMLLEEMGAWLNEFGQWKSAEAVLLAAQERVKATDIPTKEPLFYSGMFRQLAFCLIYRGAESSQVESAPAAGLHRTIYFIRYTFT